jgi:hypothetical protein
VKGFSVGTNCTSSVSLTNSLQYHLQAVSVSKLLCIELSAQQLQIIVGAGTQGRRSGERCDTAVPSRRFQLAGKEVSKSVMGIWYAQMNRHFLELISW